MIRVGIIGAGEFAHRHAKAIVQNPDTVLVAACRRNKDELDRFTGKYNIKGYTDYKELLDDKSVDAILIATSHHTHQPIAEDAAKAGKSILLEKPMAHNLQACDKIIESVDLHKARLMVGHIIRFFPYVARAKQLIDDGVIGELVYLHSHIATRWDTLYRRQWHCKQELGGGMLMTLGIHYIDLMTWIMEHKVRSVKAFVSNPFFKKEMDDASLLFLTYENGKNCMLTSSGFYNGAPILEVILTGTKGIIRVEVYKGIWLGQNNEWKKIELRGEEDQMEAGLAGEWKDFSGRIISNEPPSVTGEYGRHMVEIIEAARESSQLQKEIFLNNFK